MDARDALTMWVREGLLAADHAERLRETLAETPHEQSDETLVEVPEAGAPSEADRTRPGTSRLTRLLVFVGALLIGGGLLLFIGSQWDESSPTRRLLLLFGVYLVIVAAAALAERQRLGTTARALWFLSSIAVGVNIFLTGQIFNLTLNYWQGTLLWMIACLAMGWAAPSSAQGWLAVPLGLLTLAWLSVPSTLFFEQAAFVVDAGGIRPLLPLLGLAMITGATLVTSTPFAWLGRPLRAIGALVLAVPLTISTFHPWLFAAVFEIDFRLFHVVVVVASLAVVAAVVIRQRHPLTTMAVPALLGMLLVLLPQVGVDDDTASDLDYFDSLPWLAEPFTESALLFGIYTAVIFALALGTVAAGLQFRVPALVNVGVGVLAVQLIAVYVGRLAGTLPTSLAVLIGGVLLIGGGALLERKRRDLLVEARQ